jgi:hypothetical protein
MIAMVFDSMIRTNYLGECSDAAERSGFL